MEKIASIRKNHVFVRMYAKGKSSVQKHIVVYTYKDTRLSGARLGITAGKKLGGAVMRNRVRRMIKEAFRSMIAQGCGINARKNYIVVVARGACFKRGVKMQQVREDMERALVELKLLEPR